MARDVLLVANFGITSWLVPDHHIYFGELLKFEFPKPFTLPNRPPKRDDRFERDHSDIFTDVHCTEGGLPLPPMQLQIQHSGT